ncbi:DNA mismatch repair protein MutS [Anaeromassilibacillus senegalensis]|uniref:DNA mismatch repair protein MutS n=1 Tax=Anaeromassilibacillus senegalensis TaxID=1673717 RepID=A0ABS9CL66_9FIRM|nr:DNA mismatch repair protein MutS [Anaeromassilibacillus senegalensis]MCF2651794.1 DNA mismatch repair protein MutS [Anaeromassilibacillus senegalensis]
MADYSPMMKQYFEVKEKYPNTILFFRLGDFYEMFFNDAKTVSRELELTLTGRDCGQAERAPMCGVPFHSAETYIARLVAKGYKVAICEQMEDPALAKGIVKRNVIRVITPGTVMESSMLDESKNNYIASLYYFGENVGICFADISTGELDATTLMAKSREALSPLVINELSRFSPREILINPEFTDFSEVAKFISEKLSASLECMDFDVYAPQAAEEAVRKQFHSDVLERSAVLEHREIVMALGALLDYLSRTQITGLERMEEINVYSEAKAMRLDLNTRRNLELLETMRSKERRGSLLWVLDKTKTAMGKRLIRTWLEQPLLSPAKITLRQNAVEELFNNRPLLDGITESLTGIFDLERIMTRVVYGSVNGKDLRALWSALTRLPQLKTLVAPCEATMLRDIEKRIDALEDVCTLIDKAIVEEPPHTIREGGIIREGFDPELDSVKNDMTNGKQLIAELEAREREATGIPKLRVGFNRVFGYYLEVSNAFKDKTPEHYIRKQTLANGERYITQELKELENRILGAHDKSIAMESKLFEEVRHTVADQLTRIQETAKAIAQLDVLASFATVSIRNDYTRPTITMNGRLYLKDSRHPVVEALLGGSTPFVPNDLDMDPNNNRVSIITGPNMAGKSTYMRQVAVIVIMAQIGCFVPAAAAEIGIVDGIYTRVGASDDLAAGQSTFMVEMAEVADILKNATSDSLLILDEIGRGTSTFDGMSIARAVIEYVHDKKLCGAKTLFATHYHELTELEDLLPGVRNFSIAVKKRGDEITFLRRIVRGGADDSFGIEVAKLAGVPDKVVRRAKQVLQSLESGEAITVPKNVAPPKREEPIQLTMLTKDGEVLRRLKNLDVNTLTPIESMNILFELANMLKD